MFDLVRGTASLAECAQRVECLLRSRQNSTDVVEGPRRLRRELLDVFDQGCHGAQRVRERVAAHCVRLRPDRRQQSREQLRVLDHVDHGLEQFRQLIGQHRQ